MNCEPGIITPEELDRVKELFTEVGLDTIRQMIESNHASLKDLEDKDEILQKLQATVDETTVFCEKVSQKESDDRESSWVLLQLQTTKLVVMRELFDFYSLAKQKLGSNADVIIEKNEKIAPKIKILFGTL